MGASGLFRLESIPWLSHGGVMDLGVNRRERSWGRLVTLCTLIAKLAFLIRSFSLTLSPPPPSLGVACLSAQKIHIYIGIHNVEMYQIALF